MTLLDKAKTNFAKKLKLVPQITSEQKKLAAAYLTGAIRLSDVAVALGKTSANPVLAYAFLARCCRSMSMSKELIIKLKQ